MDSYFSKFPIIEYNNVLCKDISRSARMTEEARRNSTLFYPVTIEAGFRADNLSEAYYKDAEMDWLIWISNDIIDPYYEWYLTEIEFDNFIQEKYGSQADAIKKIVYYKNNWDKLDEFITTSFYDNNIALDLKKYYTPEFGPNNKIIRYIRKQEDWSTNTNRIVEYSHDANVMFTTSEIVDIKYSGEIVASGEVVTSNLTHVSIQHVSGNLVANSTLTKTIIGESSKVTANTSSYKVVQINLSDAESVFWDAVTAFDIERERNEARKNLFVINSEYAMDVSESLRLKLKDV